MKFLLHLFGSAAGIAVLFGLGIRFLAMPSPVAVAFALGGSLLGEALAGKLRHFHEN